MVVTFSDSAMRAVVARVCQSVGWHATHSTPLEVLTQVLSQYMQHLSATCVSFAEHCGRREPSLDDVWRAFSLFDIQLNELRDYVTNVESDAHVLSQQCPQLFAQFPVKTLPQNRLTFGSLLQPNQSDSEDEDESDVDTRAMDVDVSGVDGVDGGGDRVLNKRSCHSTEWWLPSMNTCATDDVNNESQNETAQTNDEINDLVDTCSHASNDDNNDDNASDWMHARISDCFRGNGVVPSAQRIEESEEENDEHIEADINHTISDKRKANDSLDGTHSSLSLSERDLKNVSSDSVKHKVKSFDTKLKISSKKLKTMKMSSKSLKKLNSNELKNSSERERHLLSANQKKNKSKLKLKTNEKKFKHKTLSIKVTGLSSGTLTATSTPTRSPQHSIKDESIESKASMDDTCGGSAVAVKGHHDLQQMTIEAVIARACATNTDQSVIVKENILSKKSEKNTMTTGSGNVSSKKNMELSPSTTTTSSNHSLIVTQSQNQRRRGRPKKSESLSSPTSVTKLNMDENDDDNTVEWICPQCLTPDNGSPMIGCDSCDKWYHWQCVGVLTQPKADSFWICSKCKKSSKQSQQQTTALHSTSTPSSSSSSTTASSLKRTIDWMCPTCKRTCASSERHQHSQQQQNTIVCIECYRCYHMHCVSLTTTPSRGFTCASCKCKRKALSSATTSSTSGSQWLCPVCKTNDTSHNSIGCDECDEWYHWKCVQLTEEPREEDSWFCPKCIDRQSAIAFKFAKTHRNR